MMDGSRKLERMFFHNPTINVDGRYPCMANWVVLKKTKDGIIARNSLTDEEVKLSDREAKYLTRLNGNRHQYKIEGFSVDECFDYYRFLKNYLLVREPGRNMSFGDVKLHTVLIPNKTRTNSVIPKILNFLLWISFLPVFIYGLYRILTYGVIWGMEENSILNFLLGNIGGIFLGMILHESAHAFACLSDRNGRLFEAGLMLNGFLPGAYVLIDESEIKSRLKKAQINLAGVEMNLLLSGVLMILMTLGEAFGEWKTAMLFAVIQNVFLALINLTFAEGLDGEHTISTLLGGSVVDAAKANLSLLFDRKRRKNYFAEHGICGVAAMCTSLAVLGFQLIIPLVIIADISICIGGLFL